MVASLKSKAKQSFIYFSFILKLLKRRQVLYVWLKYKYLLLFYRGASCNCLFRSNKRYGNACYFFTTSNMSRYVNCKTTTSGKQNRRGIFFFMTVPIYIFHFFFNSISSLKSLLTRSKNQFRNFKMKFPQFLMAN